MSDDPQDPHLETFIEPELEARVVAWVLGEASAFEVAELERIIADQPELAIFKRRIEAVHGLVGEATAADWKPLRLAPERREKLMAAVGLAGVAVRTKGAAVTVMPQRQGGEKRPVWHRVAFYAAACLVVGGLATIIIPTIGSVQMSARRSVVMEQLQTESAQRFDANGSAPATPPASVPLVGYPAPSTGTPAGFSRRGGVGGAGGGGMGGAVGGGRSGGGVRGGGAAGAQSGLAGRPGQLQAALDALKARDGGAGGAGRTPAQKTSTDGEFLTEGSLYVTGTGGVLKSLTAAENLAATNAEARNLSDQISRQLGGPVANPADRSDSTNPSDTAPLDFRSSLGFANDDRTNSIVATGNNTYTGSTTILGGTLSTGATGILADGGTASSIGASSNAAGSLVLDGGALQYAKTGGTTSTDRLFTFGVSGGTLDASGTGSLSFTNTGSLASRAANTTANTFAPVIADSTGGSTSLVKNGAGQWMLAANSSFTGATTISGGTLSTRNGAGNLVLNGGALQYANTSGATSTDRLFTLGTGGSTIESAGTGSLQLQAVNGKQSTTYGGDIRLNESSLNKAVTGTVVLSNPSNTYNGSTTVNGGQLAVTGAGFSTSGSNLNLTLSGAISNTAPARTDTVYGSFNGPLNDSHVLDSKVNVDVGGGWNGSGSGAASGLTKVGTGTFTLSGANTYTGGITVTTGTQSNSSAYSMGGGTVSSALSGSGGVTVATGTVSLSGSSTYTGGTTVSSGVLALRGAGTLGSGALTVNGGTFDLGSTSQTVSGLTLTSGSISGATLTGSSYIVSSGNISAALAGSGSLTMSGKIETLSGANTFTGPTTINSGTLAITGGSALTVNSSAVTGIGSLSVHEAGSGYSYAGSLSDSPTAQNWSGNFTFQGSNPLMVKGSGSLTMNGGTLATTGNATLNPSRGVTLGEGGGSLTKADAGTLSLSGVNNYSGTTVVSGGTLVINSDSAHGAAQPANSVTLNGGTLSTSATFTLNTNRGLTLSGGGTPVLTNLGGTTQSGSSLTRSNGGTFIGGAFQPAPLVNLGLGAANGSSAGAAATGRIGYAVLDEGVKAKMNVRQSTLGDQPNLVIMGTALGSFTNTGSAASDQLNIDQAMIKFDTNTKPVEGTVDLYYAPGTPAQAAASSAQNREYVPVTKETLSRLTGNSTSSGSADDAAALKKFLQSAGVDFDGVAGAGIAYNGSTLAVTQTPKNMDKIRNILARYNDVKQVSIETKFVEVANDKDTSTTASPSVAEQEVNAKRAAAATARTERARTLAEISGAEIKTTDETYSTFSLHVSDVSFKLALAALAKGQKPDPASIRQEEFYNAFDYGDPSPAPGEPVACRIEQSAHPVLQQRNLVRIALRVPATGRDAAQPLCLTVLLDASGSMERADRAACVHAALASLASLLGPNDRVTLIAFSRTPRLLAQELPGNEAAKLVALTANLPFEGGTNLEEALKLAGAEARRQQTAGAQNRIVLLTDGAANLGDADPERLAQQIAALRQQGITLDACGVVASGLDDGMLEALTRKGDGRYYLLNAPEDADAGFARQLAGAFHPAAENAKVQVHFNPARVASYRLIGFEANRLKTEDFHNDAVTAAQLASEEAAVALYQVEVLPQGDGELGDVSVRFRETATGNMIERTWTILDDPSAKAFDQATPTMQLAGTAAMLAEKLRGGAVASLFRLDALAPTVNALRGHYANEPRVQDLSTMFGAMRRIFGE